MDNAAYEATTRTVGKWIVPLAKAQHIEKELNGLRKRVRELEVVADLATGLDTGQDCDPAHHGLVCAAMAALNFTENVNVKPSPL